MKIRTYWVSLMTCFFIIFSVYVSHAFWNQDVTKAKKFISAGMYPQAISLLEKRINDEPTDAEAHFQLGNCYVYTGKYSSADQRYSSAVKLEPDYGYKIADSYMSAANENLATYKLSHAKACYDKAVTYNPKVQNPEFFHQIGYRYLKLAADSYGGKRSSYKQKAAHFCGKSKVKEIFGEPYMKTIHAWKFTDEDTDEYGRKIVFRMDDKKTKRSDVVEIIGTVEGSNTYDVPEIGIANCKGCDPEWDKTENGYYSEPNPTMPIGKDFEIYFKKGYGIIVNVKVQRLTKPEPDVAKLERWIKQKFHSLQKNSSTL